MGSHVIALGTLAHGRGRRTPIVRITHEIRPLRHRASLDQRQQRIPRQPRRNLHARQVQDRRDDVHGRDQARGVEGAPYPVLPVEDERRAERLVVQPVLAQGAAVAKQKIVGDGRVLALLVLDIGILLPAVVADEDEQRIFHEAAALDMVHQPVHSVVPPGEVGVVEFGRLRDVHVLVVLPVGVRRIERHVRQRGREPDEERLFPMPVDEVEHRLHGLANEFVPFGAHQLLEKRVPAIGGHVPAFAHAFGEMAVEVGVLPPLAPLPTHVARLAQQLRQRVELPHGGGLFDLLPQALLLVAQGSVVRVGLAAALDNLVLAQNILDRMQPGDHRAQRRAAIGRRHMGVGKRHPARGKRIHRRGDDVLVAHEPIVWITVVVTDQEHDIRRPLGECGAGQQQHQNRCQDFCRNYAIHLTPLQCLHNAGWRPCAPRRLPTKS